MNSSLSALISAEPKSGFATLTLVCFAVLCRHLSFSDLLSCSRVNRHWRTHAISYCRTQIFKFEIVLLEPNGWKRYQKLDIFSSLYSEDGGAHLLNNEDGSRLYPKLPKKCLHSLRWSEWSGWSEWRPLFSHSLTNTLSQFLCTSKIHTLTIGLRPFTDSELTSVILLLRHFASLVSLNLCIASPRDASIIPRSHTYESYNKRLAEYLPELFAAINRLHSLKRLTLRIFSHIAPLEPELVVLSWLHEFTFFSEDTVDLLYSTLCRHVPGNPHLYKIDYAPYYCKGENIYKNYIRTAAGRLVARAMINISERGYHPESFEELPAQLDKYFPSVTSVTLYIFQHRWWDVMQRLALLPQLRQIKMELFILQPGETPSPEDTLPPLQLPVLPSVLIIDIRTKFTDHDELLPLHLPHLFPRLQALALEYKFWMRTPERCCRACWKAFHATNELIENQNREAVAIEHCVRAAFREWKQVGQNRLKYVKLGYKSWLNLDRDIFGKIN